MTGRIDTPGYMGCLPISIKTFINFNEIKIHCQEQCAGEVKSFTVWLKFTDKTKVGI